VILVQAVLLPWLEILYAVVASQDIILLRELRIVWNVRLVSSPTEGGCHVIIAVRGITAIPDQTHQLRYIFCNN